MSCSGSGCYPEKVAIELTSREAVEFAKKMESSAFNGYGIGEIGTMEFLNRRGFSLRLHIRM